MVDNRRRRDGPQISGNEAKSGRRGLPVLAILIVGLLLLALFWIPTAWFGEATDPSPEEAIGTGESIAPAEDEGEVPPVETPAGAEEEPGEGTEQNAETRDPEPQ